MTHPDNEPLVYLNGQFLPRSQAHLDIEDRGVLFADGVYEVVRYYNGRAFEGPRHLARLRRSLAAIELAEPPDTPHLEAIADELVRRNGWSDASIYWQITRGPAPRQHLFPSQVQPTVLVMGHPLDPVDPTQPPAACRAILLPDERWANCWIKTLMLLPNVLAKNRAARAGAQEAIFYRDHRITEGTSTNVLIVLHNTIWTHPADRWILAGITRDVILEEARALGLPVREEAVRLDQLPQAQEILLTGSTTQLAAVTHLADQPVGHGRVGPLARRLWRAFLQRVNRQCQCGWRLEEVDVPS